ncbi:hypothetical protein B0H12DRAFT_1164363 [Mycena haematopus]|nr:hypothetical protein B0H12DRAFT_1164363 [Mycena haematopus]
MYPVCAASARTYLQGGDVRSRDTSAMPVWRLPRGRGDANLTPSQLLLKLFIVKLRLLFFLAVVARFLIFLQSVARTGVRSGVGLLVAVHVVCNGPAGAIEHREGVGDMTLLYEQWCGRRSYEYDLDLGDAYVERAQQHLRRGREEKKGKTQHLQVAPLVDAGRWSS